MNENATELLGEVVAWDLPNGEAKLRTVLDALTAAGISTDIPELRSTTAFNRACKPLKKDKVVRAHKKDKDVKRYQLDRVDEDGAHINYDYVATVALDTDTGRVTCGEDYELAQTLQQGVQEQLETRTASDITRIVQTLFVRNADLFPLVPKKGVAYFVPAAHADFVERVDRFLKAMGGRLCRMPVPKGTPQGNASVQDAVKTGLDEMVAELQEAVAGWEPGKTRTSTANKALQRWEAIRHKVDCYSVFLEAEREKLGASLEIARQQLAGRIDELTAAAEEAANAEPDGAEQADPATVEKAARRAAVSEGWDAAEAGVRPEANPYSGTPRAKDWDEGYMSAVESQAA